MSEIVDYLKTQRREVEAQLEALKVKIHEIDAALQGIENVLSTKTRPAKPSNKMSLNDAIIEAIKSGHGTPTLILKYIQEHLGFITTKNSVSTRLTRLKNKKLVSHDGSGWIMPKTDSIDAIRVTENVGTVGPTEAKTEDVSSIFGFHNPNPSQVRQ